METRMNSESKGYGGGLHIRVTENVTGMHVMSSVQERRVRSGSGTSHPITYGDEIRVTFNMTGRQPMIFTSRELRDMTEVLGEVRRRTRGLEGLGHLWVSNITEGWKLSRPLRLASISLLRGFGNVYATEPTAPRASRTNLPWDTQ